MQLPLRFVDSLKSLEALLLIVFLNLAEWDMQCSDNSDK